MLRTAFLLSFTILALAFPKSVTRPGRTSHSEYYAAACNVDTPLSLISNACVCVHSQNRKLGGCLPLLYPLPSFLASRVHNRKGKANRRGKKGQRKKKKKRKTTMNTYVKVLLVLVLVMVVAIRPRSTLSQFVISEMVVIHGRRRRRLAAVVVVVVVFLFAPTASSLPLTTATSGADGTLFLKGGEHIADLVLEDGIDNYASDHDAKDAGCYDSWVHHGFFFFFWEGRTGRCVSVVRKGREKKVVEKWVRLK